MAQLLDGSGSWPARAPRRVNRWIGVAPCLSTCADESDRVGAEPYGAGERPGPAVGAPGAFAAVVPAIAAHAAPRSPVVPVRAGVTVLVDRVAAHVALGQTAAGRVLAVGRIGPVSHEQRRKTGDEGGGRGAQHPASTRRPAAQLLKLRNDARGLGTHGGGAHADVFPSVVESGSKGAGTASAVSSESSWRNEGMVCPRATSPRR